MTEDHKRLLAVFEVRVRDLMALCDQQKRRIDELTAALSILLPSIGAFVELPAGEGYD